VSALICDTPIYFNTQLRLLCYPVSHTHTHTHTHSGWFVGTMK